MVDGAEQRLRNTDGENTPPPSEPPKRLRTLLFGPWRVITLIWWLVRRAAEGILSDPIITFTILAPSLVFLGLKLVRGQITNPSVTNASPIAPEILTILADGTSGPGFLDYTLQYYTGAVAWILLLFRVGNLAYGRRLNGTSVPATHMGLRDTLLLFGAILVGGILFYLGGVPAELGVIQLYVDATPTLGEWHWPPPTSPLTLQRAIIAAVSYYTYYEQQRSSPGRALSFIRKWFVR